MAFCFFTLASVVIILITAQSLLAFGREVVSRPDTAQVVIDLYLMAALVCVCDRGRQV